jgi:rhodanese-related sulfurtransferase
LCGKAISKETVSTIGDQRRLNYALQPMSEDSFLRIVTADQPDAPAYFTYAAVLNTKERPTLDGALAIELRPLDLDEVLAKAGAGAQLLDVREGTSFSNAHLAGSLNIGLHGQYATWAGTLLDRSRPVVLIAEPGFERQAALRLGRIGFDIVDGYLRDGMQALHSRADLLSSTDRMAPHIAAQAMGTAAAPQLIDVRTPPEWRAGRIDGSLNLPLNRLPDLLEGLARDRTLLVHCAGGYRSSIAASLLRRHGFSQLTELAGGLAAWQAAGLPTTAS